MPMLNSHTRFEYHRELNEALIRHCDERAPADTTIVRPGWPAFIPVGDQTWPVRRPTSTRRKTLH